MADYEGPMDPAAFDELSILANAATGDFPLAGEEDEAVTALDHTWDIDEKHVADAIQSRVLVREVPEIETTAKTVAFTGGVEYVERPFWLYLPALWLNAQWFRFWPFTMGRTAARANAYERFIVYLTVCELVALPVSSWKWVLGVAAVATVVNVAAHYDLK
jgi:hypothetical protein